MKRLIYLLIIGFSVTQVQADEFGSLISTAKDKTLGMNSRWQAIMKAVDLASPAEMEVIKKFADDENWYMRNAAIVAVSKVNFSDATVMAKKLLQDKALVVRSAAVDVLAKNLNSENKKILAAEMDKAYNFNKKSSLWIRKQIVEHMAASGIEEDKNFFSKYVFDADENVSLASASALEKITGKNLGPKTVEKWRSFVKENKWTY